MNADTFVDSNILIYAYDLDAGPKHERAAAVVQELWETGRGMISTQVLQEFYVNVTQKIPRPLSLPTARRLIEQYLVWDIQVNGPGSTLRASEFQERYQLSFWDALIISAARQGAADTLLSEDLSHGQAIEGVKIVNPFL